MKPEDAWTALRDVVNKSALADGLELTRAAVSAWTKVPAERVVEVERLTGIARQALRPDLYASSAPRPWDDLVATTNVITTNANKT